MKIQFHRIDTNVVVGLLVREFCCSGTDVSAKVLAMYAGTRTPSMEPQWLAAGLSQPQGWSMIDGTYYYKEGENFVFNQTRSLMPVTVSPISDFLIDGKYTFEVGGKKKKQNQLQNIENGYVVKDDIETGYGNIIPLWMFGMLY